MLPARSCFGRTKVQWRLDWDWDWDCRLAPGWGRSGSQESDRIPTPDSRILLC